jgi:alcohol dehydrogenase
MESTDVMEIRVPLTLFGSGALKRIGGLVTTLNASKPLIVTDPGIVRAGIIESVLVALQAAGIQADVFDQCGPEAPVTSIEGVSQRAREGGYDLLVGVGGGSVMDATKAAGFLAASPESTIQDLIEGRIPPSSLDKILIPTTAGTGAEWSSVAVFTTDSTDDRNYSYVSVKNLPEAVILDPELTRDVPARLAADAGVDALTHAIEAYTSCRANLVTDMFASTAMSLVARSLGPVVAKSSVHDEDRSRLLIASAMAMLAASAGGTGLAHFMNHGMHSKKIPLSHGAKVGLLLPYVMEYNLVSCPDRYAEIARLLGEDIEGLSTMDAALLSVAAVRRFFCLLGVPQRLSEVGIVKEDIPGFVEELMTFWAVPMAMQDARDAGPEEATEIFLRAL